MKVLTDHDAKDYFAANIDPPDVIVGPRPVPPLGPETVVAVFVVDDVPDAAEDDDR